MISTIEGILAETSPLMAIIEISGLGYEVHLPLTTMEKLPSTGQQVKLFTLTVYREDSQMLYGFYQKEERDFFRLLIEKVSGIGPRIALSILSKLSLSVLKNAIVAGDAKLIAQCPGIGKKTAARLVIELKDKISLPETVTSNIGSPLSSTTVVPLSDSRVQDAVQALVTLGYKVTEADKAVRQALAKLPPEGGTEELIKQALR